MPFTSSYEHLPRRNARSFDLDDSAAKAAAWVWHLHTSKPGVTTEGRFISSQSRRRSSSNYDRKATRFQQEASTTTSAEAGGNNKRETPLWDCGSNLYDTYELVAFGNRLDRSLMEAVPITPPQAAQGLQEHHMKSPLHEPSGILRTLSLPRSVSQQTSKNYTPTASPSPSKFKLSKSHNDGARASSIVTAQRASAKWSRVGKFMNAIKRMVVLHKQVSFVGCKRSVNVIESSQRPLDPKNDGNHGVCAKGSQLLVNDKVKAILSTSNFKSNECRGDEFSTQNAKVSTNSGTRGAYKLSIPTKDKSNDDCNMGDLASMQRKIRVCGSQNFGSGGLSMRNGKIRPNSESKRDGLLSDYNKIRPRRKCVGDEPDDRIKGGNLEGVNVKERNRGANEHLDYHKHLHHHHHHHHHHYLHHNLVSESARLSPETMSKICAEQSWLI